MKSEYGYPGDATRNWEEVPCEQLQLMKLVERVVRPVQASRTQRRKMREELLSHLSALYDEELFRLGDAKAALDAAAARFGDPAELSKDLGRALPPGERLFCPVRRLLGWRPEETEIRFTARVSGYLLGLVLAGVAVFTGVLAWRFTPWHDQFLWMVILPVMMALALLFALYTFLMGLLYIKLRDSLWGAFGARRSNTAVLEYAIGIALAQLANPAVAFPAAFMEWSPWNLIPTLLVCSVGGTFAAWLHYYIAREYGPEQISDRIWATLDLQTE